MKNNFFIFSALLCFALQAGKLYDPQKRFALYQGYLTQFSREIKVANNEERMVIVRTQMEKVFSDFMADFCYLRSYIDVSSLQKIEWGFLECIQRSTDYIEKWRYNVLYTTNVVRQIPHAAVTFQGGEWASSDDEELEVPLPVRVATIEHWLDPNINSLPNIDDIVDNDYSDISDFDSDFD